MQTHLKPTPRKNTTMADSLSARQQIIDKIKEVSNILVTVSQDPSVDQLSAALGLTIMLNNLKKHTTAVVSGAIPPAITFLEPEKTFEGSVDSLRDFIIALDKEKADHLRYKVDGDVVKIFITPYKTTLTESDLDFSQGDYNVELVLALGVQDEAHLDKALEAHGKILHDATVASLSAGTDTSKLGSINWHDDAASSLSEMLVSLSEAIKGDKPLLDEQSSSALLTGIVAATDRFSNEKTTSKVMTMSAQLMAAGANQQLIATKLQEARAIGADTAEPDVTQNDDGTTTLEEDTSAKVDTPTEDAKSDGSLGGLAINHEKEGDIDDVAKQVADEATGAAEQAANEIAAAPVESTSGTTPETAMSAEEQLAQDLSATITPSAPVVTDNELSAASNAPAPDMLREEERKRNEAILNHQDSTPTSGGPTVSPINSSVIPDQDEPPTVDVFEGQAPTLAQIDSAARGGTQTVSSTPPTPDTSALPPLPDFSTLPPPPSIPMPPAPPISTGTPASGGAAVSEEKLAELFGSPSTPAEGTPESTGDPGQFKIPGQS